MIVLLRFMGVVFLAGIFLLWVYCIMEYDGGACDDSPSFDCGECLFQEDCSAKKVWE